MPQERQVCSKAESPSIKPFEETQITSCVLNGETSLHLLTQVALAAGGTGGSGATGNTGGSGMCQLPFMSYLPAWIDALLGYHTL